MSSTTVFFLGSHPALSAAELVAYADRTGVSVSWDWSRLPVVLLGSGPFPAPQEMQAWVGGTTMIGTLRATLAEFPTAADLIQAVRELPAPRQGKRVIGLSALPLVLPLRASRSAGQARSVSEVGPAPRLVPRSSESEVGSPEGEVGYPPGDRPDLASAVRRLALALKHALGLKGTRVVFPPARRPDLSTAQLFHNDLPKRGVAIFLLIGKSGIDLVTIDALQDIEAYARRDRGRPKVDPGHGMLPPKLAQMLINLSRVQPGGTIYDPFCGVGTIPMEALLMRLNVVASDRSEKQVQRAKENLEWLERTFARSRTEARLFVHDVTKGSFPSDLGTLDAVVTEGFLGPSLTAPPSPSGSEKIFSSAKHLLEKLLSSTSAVLRKEGRAVVTLPAFRIGKRVVRFPVDSVRAGGFRRESLVPAGVDHQIFREASSGTLLYGRPDAVTLREIVRFRPR